jgi:hypothetical protein
MQDVLDDLREPLIPAKKVVPEAGLPERALDAEPPRCTQGQVFELSHKRHDVAGRRRTENEMDVVGHHTPGVDRHARRRRLASEDVNGGVGDGRTGEDRRAALHRDGDRAGFAGVGIGGRCEPDAATLRVLFGHSSSITAWATAGDKPPPYESPRGRRPYP